MGSLKSVVVAGVGLAALSAAALAAVASSAEPTTSITTAVLSAAPRDACGGGIAKPGGGYWSCSLVENFSGSRLNDALWAPVVQPGDSELCMVDNPRTVSVGGGRLRLSIIKTDARTACPARPDGSRASYAGGWVSSFYRWSQQYGRIEARIKVQWANQPGLHEAFWLWPDVRHGAAAPWPASGEIDVMETFSSHPGLAVPYLHYGADDNGGAVPGLNTSWSCAAPRGAWHTYVLEWTATRVAILIDGKTCLVNTAAAPSYRKRFILNFTQFVGGSGSNVFRPGVTRLPATMEVDYVRAWS